MQNFSLVLLQTIFAKYSIFISVCQGNSNGSLKWIAGTYNELSINDQVRYESFREIIDYAEY